MSLNGDMTNHKKSSSLKQRLLEIRNRYSILGDKPQDLSFPEIQARVQDFLIDQEDQKNAFAFGEGIAVGNASEKDAQFDPVKEFEANPNKLDELIMYVEFDMEIREDDLLKEAVSFESSYNTLLFGAAMKLARKEDISDDLREFLVNHLISPLKKWKKREGRPKITKLDEKFRYFAIEFARKHGLSATRHDEKRDRDSACDVVSAAALALYHSGMTEFGTGYGFDNLKKIWMKYSKRWPPFVGSKLICFLYLRQGMEYALIPS